MPVNSFFKGNRKSEGAEYGLFNPIYGD